MARKTEKVKTEEVDLSQYRRIHKEDIVSEKKGLSPKAKKLIKIIACAVVIIGIIGAVIINAGKQKNAYTKVTDASQALVSGDVTITKQDYYTYLMEQFGADETINKALTAIADKEVTDQKKIDKIVKESEQTYITYYESLAKAAKELGFPSEKALINERFVPEAKLKLLQTQYLEKNFDSLVSEYQVAYLKYISFEKESQALKAIAKSTSEKEFTKLYTKNSDNASDLGLVTKKTDGLDENLQKILGELSAVKKDGIYATAVKLSDDKYAAVYVYNTDKTKKRQDIIDALVDLEDIQTTVTASYLKKYNFTVYDNRLKQDIKKEQKKYIN